MQNGRRAGAPSGTRRSRHYVPQLSRPGWHGHRPRTTCCASAYSIWRQLARRESVAKFAQTQASEVARLKEKNKELKFKLRHMWDWHNNEITKTGGLTFKASSLIAKALHPDATPSEEIRLDAFKAFSAWKSDRDVARRR